MTDHNSSEHDNSSTTIQDGDHLVTESLLSWAKDVRYVREIQSMLAEAAEPLFSGASIAPSVVSKGTWYASYLLYILISVGRQGRTLGMGATGLQLTISSGHNSLSKRRIVGSLMALGMSTWALDWWATKSDRESESSHSEGLRGIERQRRHELLRQQMLQRATSSSQSTVVHSNQSQSRESNNSSEELSFQGKLVNNLQTLIKSFLHAIGESTRDGPHNLPIHNDGSSRSISVITWILRFHLAQYLITGKYPTILHRIMGVRHEPKEQQSWVPIRPGTHKVVALLIAVQGSASLIRHFLKWWTDRVALYLERRTNRERIANQKTPPTKEPSNASQYPILSVCAICRAPRTQPAASSACGHVFCWACLNHWISSVKEACPYCRAPCRLEDIQPLYSYDHLNPSSVPAKTDKTA